MPQKDVNKVLDLAEINSPMLQANADKERDSLSSEEFAAFSKVNPNKLRAFQASANARRENAKDKADGVVRSVTS